MKHNNCSRSNPVLGVSQLNPNRFFKCSFDWTHFKTTPPWFPSRRTTLAKKRGPRMPMQKELQPSRGGGTPEAQTGGKGPTGRRGTGGQKEKNPREATGNIWTVAREKPTGGNRCRKGDKQKPSKQFSGGVSPWGARKGEKKVKVFDGGG